MLAQKLRPGTLVSPGTSIDLQVSEAPTNSDRPGGDPAKTIERIAAEGGFDTVILGSRGLGAISRALQGSISEHVSTHAETTVIVAR